MKKLLMTLVVALLTASPSYADVFDFAYSITATASFPTAVTASGTLVADPTATPGEFLVTSIISGTRNGETITGLLPVGSIGVPPNDNLIFTTDPHLDINGLGYTVAGAGNDGAGDVNVFFLSGFGYTELEDSVGSTTTFTLTPVNAVPLPAALPLFATGLGALGLLGWRRKRKAQAVA